MVAFLDSCGNGKDECRKQMPTSDALAGSSLQRFSEVRLKAESFPASY